MTTSDHPDSRVTAALRAFIDDLPDPSDGFAGRSPVAARGVRRRSHRWVVVTAALAPVVVLVAVFVVGRTALVDRPAPAEPRRSAYLPSELPTYSRFTGFAGTSPPGPALLAWGQGGGVELFDAPQYLVLGADGREVRRVAQPEREVDNTHDAAPSLLSPNGELLAVGTAHGEGTLDLVDLTTGHATRHHEPCTRDAVPAGWSPDGDSVWVVCVDHPNPRIAPRSSPGQLVRVDLSDGSVTSVEGARRVDPAQFVVSPDGRYVVTQRARPIVIDTETFRRVAQWAPDPAGSLARNGWSPDGAHLLFNGFDGLTVGDLDGPRLDPRVTVVWSTEGQFTVLGWVSDTQALVVPPSTGQEAGAAVTVATVNVITGEHHVVSSMEDTWADAAPYGFSMATGLSQGLTLGPPLPVDRGPLPLGWWLAGGVLLLGCCGAGYLLLRRRHVPAAV